MNGFRPVMVDAFYGEFSIVDRVGIEGNGGAGRAPTEKVDETTRSHRGDRVRPDLRYPGRVDRDPGAPTVLSFGKYHIRLTTATGNFNGFGSTQFLTNLEAAGIGIGQNNPKFKADLLLSAERPIEEVEDALRSMMRKESLKVVIKKQLAPDG